MLHPETAWPCSGRDQPSGGLGTQHGIGDADLAPGLLGGVGGLHAGAVGAVEVPDAVGVALGLVAVAVFEQVVVLAGDAAVGGVGEPALGVALEVVEFGDRGSDQASEPHTSWIERFEDLADGG